MHAWSRLFWADLVSGSNLRSLRDLNVSKALSFSPKLEPLLKVDHQGRQARSLSGSCPLELGCNYHHGSLQLSKDKQVDTVGILLTMAGKSQRLQTPSNCILWLHWSQEPGESEKEKNTEHGTNGFLLYLAFP